MTSEWMADAQMREWANQSLPRAKSRDEVPDEPALDAGQEATLLEQAKETFLRLPPSAREQFLQWLASGTPAG